MILFRRSRRTAVVCSVTFAMLLGVTLGAYHASAARGITGDFTVEIIDPVEEGDTFELIAYTPDAQVPRSLPIGVTSLVTDNQLRGELAILDSVRTVLGGDVDEVNGRITGEDQSVEATLLNEGESDAYVAVVDARRLDFEEVSTGLAASDFIRTVAIVDEYYSGDSRTVSNIAGISEIGLDIEIRDLAEVDADGNLIPDATSLLQRSLLLIGENGDICIVIALDNIVRGGSSDVSTELSFDSALGPITIQADAPTLETLQALTGTELDAFDTARLILGISRNDTTLLDGPDGVDPLGEFDLNTPEPRNLFVRTNIAFTTVGDRGAPVPSWSFAGTDVLETGLPSGGEFELLIFGPGIADLLEGGSTVAAYTYNISMIQDDGNLLALGDENGWEEIDDVATSNNFNSDDDADARVVIANDGDDTISIESGNPSAIYASNAVPSLESGGGDSSGFDFCFIATAAYGTPMAEEIGVLRGVRDRFMLTNALGAAIADAYYRVSPPVAEQLAQNEAARGAVRGVLTPIIAASRWMLVSPAAAMAATVLLIATMGLFSLRRPSM